MGHQENTEIYMLLEGATLLESYTIGKGKRAKQVYTYSTMNGLVEFRDYASGGWSVLTECPSDDTSEIKLELVAMLEGKARARSSKSQEKPTLDAVHERSKPERSKPELERDDFSPTVRDMANAAVRMGLIDPFGLALLVHRHGTDRDALLIALDDLAGSQRRAEEIGPANAWAALRAAVTWLADVYEPPKPGAKLDEFMTNTRHKMLAVVERHAVRVREK